MGQGNAPVVPDTQTERSPSREVKAMAAKRFFTFTKGAHQMSILDLLKGHKPTPEQAQATLERLHEEQREAQAWLIASEAELAAALLDKAEGVLDGAGIAKSRKAVADAKQAIQDAELTLACAERRLDAAAGDEAARLQAVRQKEVVALCKQRHALGLKYQKQAVDLASIVAQTEELTAEIYSLLPGNPDVTATLTSRADLYQAFREQLARAGATPWSIGPFSPWELERRPDLLARIEAANEMLGA
jgi:hypothetical protein